MPAFLQSHAFQLFSTVLIGTVWLIFGLYFKILNRVPRHRQIVERVLGARFGAFIFVIGIGEVLLGLWVFSGWYRVPCAIVLTLSIVAMNTLEVWLARDLLVSAPGMLVLNALLIALVWNWALAAPTV